jgi:hypothetical protein
MKLTIRRDQADVRGLLGGHKGVKFKLSAKVDISGEERGLIDRYKVGEYVLASYELGSQPTLITVSGIIGGRSIETESITKLLELEDTVKQGCQNLKTLLTVMATFGGEEVIEY